MDLIKETGKAKPALGKIASVLLKLFINGNESCPTTDAP